LSGVQQSSEQLVSLIAARRGHFRLESGHHSDRWLDLDRLLLRPSRLRPFAVELARRLQPHGIDAVCGPLVGGALLAQVIASELDLDFYYAERFQRTTDGLYPMDYRLPAGVRSIVRGQRVAVVDDAISAGSAVRGTLADLQACAARPAAMGALLVLGGDAASLAATAQIPLETPAECALGVDGIPLKDPTGP
jgi:orotate phosphoribosyltransferase